MSPFLGKGQAGSGGCFSDFLVMEVGAAGSADFKCTFAINFLWTWFVAEEVSASRAARRDAHADFDRCLFQFASEQLRISCLWMALRRLSS